MTFDLDSARTQSGLTPTHGQGLGLGKSLFPVGRPDQTTILVRVKDHSISAHNGIRQKQDLFDYKPFLSKHSTRYASPLHYKLYLF